MQFSRGWRFTSAWTTYHGAASMSVCSIISSSSGSRAGG
jgi:hypothetical protein